MVYCAYCGEYIGLFVLSRFCDDCAQLRRILLLNNKSGFISKIREMFLYEYDPIPNLPKEEILVNVSETKSDDNRKDKENTVEETDKEEAVKETDKETEKKNIVKEKEKYKKIY